MPYGRRNPAYPKYDPKTRTYDSWETRRRKRKRVRPRRRRKRYGFDEFAPHGRGRYRS